MSTATVEMSGLDEPLSPELVLVLPPEAAAIARRLLPRYPFVLPTSPAAVPRVGLGRGFVVFVATCIVATVGPFLLALLTRAHH
jgi:hypothetical protein